MSNKIKTTEMKQDKRGLVPKLRFPEFKDAGGWEEKELQDLGDLVSGLTYSPDDVRENGLLVLRSSNIKDGLISLEDTVYVDQNVKGVNLSKPNDILICVRNGSKNLIGKNALIPKGLPLCTHGAFMTVFRSKSWKFVFQLFQTTSYQKQVNGDLGATINSINSRHFVKYKFYVPNPPEQQKIANCLSSIDDLITAESKKLESIKNHKKGLMQNLFPSEGKTTPNFRFPEFKNDGEWEVKPLGKICKYSNGGGNENNVVDNGKYYLISLNSIDTEGNLKPNMKRVNHIDNSLIKNDLVMVLSDVAYGNFLGLSAIIPNNNYVLNQRMAGLRVRSNQNINIEYLRLFINNNQKYFKQKGQGSSQQNLSKPSVERFPIFLPNNPKEQQKIADCLSSIDDLITSQGQKIEALKTHKKGLMQQLFPNIDQNHKSK